MTNQIPNQMVANYLSSLVNKFYKILPLREADAPTLQTYMDSLMVELVGCQSVIDDIDDDAMYFTLIAILGYLATNDCDVSVVKREVFKAIDICKKLACRYGGV